MALNDYITYESAILIVIVLAVLAFFIPAAFSAQNTPVTETVNQEIETTISFTPSLDVTLDTVNEPQQTINVTIYNSETGRTDATNDLGQGQSVSLSLNGDTITVTNHEVLSATNALVGYEYPTFFGWPSGAADLLQLLTGLVVIIFAAFVWFVISLQKERNDG